MIISANVEMWAVVTPPNPLPEDGPFHANLVVAWDLDEDDYFMPAPIIKGNGRTEDDSDTKVYLGANPRNLVEMVERIAAKNERQLR